MLRFKLRLYPIARNRFLEYTMMRSRLQESVRIRLASQNRLLPVIQEDRDELRMPLP
jgi:hypothetical protein